GPRPPRHRGVVLRRTAGSRRLLPRGSAVRIRAGLRRVVVPRGSLLRSLGPGGAVPRLAGRARDGDDRRGRSGSAVARRGGGMVHGGAVGRPRVLAVVVPGIGHDTIVARRRRTHHQGYP